MASGEHDPATLRRYSEAQARLEHAGGYAWRERVDAALRGLGFADDDLDRELDTFSGGELTRASLARALGGDPDLLLLDEPTNHLDVDNIEWLEQTLQSTRRSRHPRRARPLVPRGDDDRRARAGGRPLDVLRRAVARVAPREGGPAARGLEGRRSRRPRHRAAGALRRALPRPQPKMATQGAGQDDAYRAPREGAGEGAGRDRSC